jgi:hypothetical protein
MDNRTKPAMGRVDNGVPAPYDFLIEQVLSESWRGITGFKATAWGGWLIVFVVSLMFGVAFSLISFLSSKFFGTSPQIFNVVDNIVTFIVTLPLIVGVMMLGVRRSVGLPVKAMDATNYMSSIWGLVGVYILQAIIMVIPVLLAAITMSFASGTDMMIVKIMLMLLAVVFFASTLYFAISYTFAMVLKVEKNLSIWGALEASRKGVTQHWFKFFFTLLAMYVFLLIGAIPLLLGWIWLLPMANLLYGVMYRTMFGVEEVR